MYTIIMTTQRQTLISGVKPTGRPHIGNYFGAMKQFVDLQKEYESWVFVANYHALTTIKNREELINGQKDLIIDYLAIGLDPQITTLFLQSSVPQVTELAWIFECLITVPYLERAHAYKDALANGKEPNGGLFNYPMLMASDILLSGADIVPVGRDQKQHIEYARDVALKFNNAFGDTFNLPKELIIDQVEVVPGNDGRKMSKSYNNHLPLFSEREAIESFALSIVTSSVPKGTPIDPYTDTIYSILSLVADEHDLATMREDYLNGTIGFKDAKLFLIEKLETYIQPFREARKEIVKDNAYIERVISEGGMRAFEKYQTTMKNVREAVGLNV